MDGEVANLLLTCWQQVVVMEFGKGHDTTDATNFSCADLLQTCYGPGVYVADLLRT